MMLPGGNRSSDRKTWPDATLFTKNLTQTDPVSKANPRRERPATNRLTHVAAATARAGRVLFASISTHSLTFQQRQFLELAVLADVKPGRALPPVLLDVRGPWIFDLIDLRWGRHVGPRRQLLLLWLLWGLLQLQLLLGCWG